MNSLTFIQRAVDFVLFGVHLFVSKFIELELVYLFFQFRLELLALLLLDAGLVLALGFNSLVEPLMFLLLLERLLDQSQFLAILLLLKLLPVEITHVFAHACSFFLRNVLIIIG
jgi:hypothetical protein